MTEYFTDDGQIIGRKPVDNSTTPDQRMGYSDDTEAERSGPADSLEEPTSLERVRADRGVWLGDQSPWAGGILRWTSTNRNTPYFIQNVDNPWVNNGLMSPVSIKAGWPKANYWNIASRFPWSWDIPGTNMENIRTSLNSPRGLCYLSGPSTSTTIFAEDQNTEVVEKTKEMLIAEAEWARRVGNFMGLYEAEERSKAWKETLTTPNSITQLVEVVANPFGLDNITSVKELFQNEPPVLKDYLGNDYYWSVDNYGRRQTINGHERDIIPKGKAIPLELAAKGFTLAFTSLGYLSEVKKIRDQYVPGLRVNLMQIQFNWELYPDPMDAMVEEYTQKKVQRGQSASLAQHDIEKVRAYWKGRPTPIAYSILGGSLSYTHNRYEL